MLWINRAVGDEKAMIVVLFEVWVDPAKGDRYFELAAALRKELDGAPGFLSVERFRSLTDEGKYLSFSVWKDRASIEAWHANRNHANAQVEGRGGVFLDYRIRVADVFRDYDMKAGRPKVSK